LKSFQLVILQHIPRENNEEANRLAQSASGYRENQEVFAIDTYTSGSDLAEDDWRKKIVDHLENPSRKVSRKLRYKDIKFVLLDDRLYYKSLDGVLLQCLSQEEAKKMMSEVHDGLCGAHQSAYRMKWVIRKNGCYWPTMLEDCFEYYKGCQGCQRFGNIQRVPASALNPIIKPWPFRGWVSYGPPWGHYLGGYQDRLLGGPLGLPYLRCTVPDGVKHKDYRGEVLG
jgi:hypothetical protein